MRILTGLRAVTRITGSVEVRFSSVGSPFLRQVMRRFPHLVPKENPENWCSIVWARMARVCRTWHLNRSMGVIRSRTALCENCPGGLVVWNLPIIHAGRVVGLVETAVPAHPREGGGFARSFGRIRHLGLDRGRMRAVHAQFTLLPKARIRRVLEVSRDVAEAVLSTYRTVAPPALEGRDTEPGEAAGHGMHPIPPPRTAGLSEQVRSLVRAHHLERGLSRRRLAELLGCAPVSISHRLRKETGESLPQFRTRLRLESAREMLGNTAFTVAEVAERTGFGSLRQFNRAFRRSTGRTPAQYRSARRKGEVADSN